MLMDVGSHRFDLMTHLFGMPREICGFTSKQCLSQHVEDAAAIAFRFDGDVLGSAHFHWNTPIARDDMTVVGTAGVLSIGDLSGRAELTLECVDGKERWTSPAPTPVHLPLVEKVVDHLLDQAPNPCSGEQGAYPNAIIERLSL
jgi:predicted dehydrogenase